MKRRKERGRRADIAKQEMPFNVIGKQQQTILHSACCKEALSDEAPGYALIS